MPDYLQPVCAVNHYMAQAQLFEFQSENNQSLIFSTLEKGFFLYALIDNNVAHLCLHPGGEYSCALPPGSHRMILLSYTADWMIYKCTVLRELEELAKAYKNPEVKALILPSANIARSLLANFQKLKELKDHIKLDRACYLFFDNSINRYGSKLKARYDTRVYNQSKAAAIAEFISQNYTSEIVENVPGLAARFMVSERHLARLAKIAFGIPLHTQVIKFRMHSGLQQLIMTNRPVYEIAGLIGYREPYYFSKAFKKCFGVAPTNLIKR